MSDQGKIRQNESTQFRDEKTGALVWQMTNHPSISHHLYFLTRSFLPDEKSLIFASFRNGAANFYRASFPSGPIQQLTDMENINSFSAVISGDGSTLFFTRSGSIIALDLETLRETILVDYPGWKLGEVDLSCDERWLVSAVRNSQENGIAVCAADGGGGTIIQRQTHTIIHPQFHPCDPNWIEYAADPAPRMHLIRRDGTEMRCLYTHTNSEYIVHETWLGNTGDLVFVYWPYAIKKLELPSGAIHTIAEFNAWHISPSRDGRFILCDTNHPDIGLQLVEAATGQRTTVCYPRSSNSGSQWTQTRYAEKSDFEAAAKKAASDIHTEMSWMDMKTDTVYGPQWTHPHPSLSPSHRYAAFTSDRTGYPQVYVVEIPNFRSS